MVVLGHDRGGGRRDDHLRRLHLQARSPHPQGLRARDGGLLRRRTAGVRGLGLALALALLSACETPVTYSYFVISAKLDSQTVSQDQLDRIEACAVYAQTPKREDATD